MLERQQSMKATEAKHRGQQEQDGDSPFWILAYGTNAKNSRQNLRVTKQFFKAKEEPTIKSTTSTNTVWDSPWSVALHSMSLFKHAHTHMRTSDKHARYYTLAPY